MQRLMACFTLAVLSVPGLAVALEFDIPDLVGTHGCTSLAAEVELTGADGIPERAVLRLEGEHSPGIHLACVGESFSAGATFYSRVELIPGLRSDASGMLAAETGSFVMELEFSNHLWQFDLSVLPLELWICGHPDFAPVICDGWGECPVTEIISATLIIQPAVATDASTLSEIRAVFD